MAITENQHCANCMGTLSFPMGEVEFPAGGRAGWRVVLTEDVDVRGARDVGASQPVHVLGTTTVARAVGRVDTQPSLRAHRLRLPVHDLTITHHTIMH